MLPRFSSPIRVAALVPLLVLSAGCARAGRSSPTAPLDEVRIAAIQTDEGFGFARERARGVFFEALGHAEAGDCAEAVYHFDRLVDRFPGSRFMPPALYDAAMCFARMGNDARAAQRLERLVREVPESPGTPRARLELAAAYARLDRWDRAEEQLVAVLGLDSIGPRVRLEALVQRARLSLSRGRLALSDRLAREALAYDPSHADARRAAAAAASPASVDDDREPLESLRAEALFVRAETYRLRAAAVPLAPPRERSAADRLAHRAGLMLEAQRLYFETLRRADPHWSEQAGERLGILYRDLWNDLPAPLGVPATVAEPPTSGRVAELSAEVEALVRRGLRQAELSLRQLEDLEEVPTGFAERVRAELEGVTGRLTPASLVQGSGASSSQDL